MSEDTPFERRLGRLFGDSAARGPGHGWISGVVGVFLGATAAGAVLVLHFPDLLTTEDLRARYPLPLMACSTPLSLSRPPLVVIPPLPLLLGTS